MLSNAMMQGVRTQIAQSALSSFEFFANTVMGAGLDERVCQYVQDVCVDRVDCVVVTETPRRLTEALRTWLEAQGVNVLTTVELPRTEILQWLSLSNTPEENSAVTLDVRKNEVVIQWL